MTTNLNKRNFAHEELLLSKEKLSNAKLNNVVFWFPQNNQVSEKGVCNFQLLEVVFLIIGVMKVKY